MPSVKERTASTSRATRRAIRRSTRNAKLRVSKKAEEARAIDALVALWEDQRDTIGFAVENQLHAAGWVR